MPQLKRTYPTKESIPEALAGYYKQDGEAFVIDAEGMVPATELQESESKLGEMRNTNITLKKAFKRFPGVDADDPASIEAAVIKFTDLSNREQKIRDHKLVDEEGAEALVTKRMAKATEEWTAKEAEYKRENADLSKRLEIEVIDRQLVDEASKLGVLASGIEDVKLRGRQTFHWENGQVVAKDARGEPAYGKDAKPLTITEFVSELATTDKGRHLFGKNEGTKSGDLKSGGGGSQYSGINPWAKETWNPARQGDIFLEDKEMAKRLAAEAGRPLPDNV